VNLTAIEGRSTSDQLSVTCGQIDPAGDTGLFAFLKDRLNMVGTRRHTPA